MTIKYTTQFVPFPDVGQPRTRLRSDPADGGKPSGDPYRDDGMILQTFSQHLSIALELAFEIATALEGFERSIRSGVAESALAARHEVGSRWEMMWSHLDDARQIAVRRGRDVSRYDSAREAACDLSSAAADVEIGEWRDAGFNAYRRTVHYRIPRREPMLAAITALEQAVPEVPIVRPPEPPDLRLGRGIPWKWILLAMVVALAVCVAVYEWNLVHNNAAFR